MKKQILDDCLAKTIKYKDGARMLSMHYKAFLRLKKHYVEQGEQMLVPQKPGPKSGLAHNRTPEAIEEIVADLTRKMRGVGPIGLADTLLDVYGIKLNSVTVWRILKRKGIRYRRGYKKQEREKPKLYCLDEPGIELQADGCYPFGRARKIVCYDAIDDCSRWVYAELFEGTENTAKMIAFIGRLIKKAPFRIQSIKVDNRYSKELEKFCEGHDIRVIRIEAYTPKQNGKIERYHQTVKKNLFWRRFEYGSSMETLRYELFLWIGYYNCCRRHRGYGMNGQTPNGKISSILAQKLYNSVVSSGYPQKVTLTMQQYTH